jgi:hypothetical protein
MLRKLRDWRIRLRLSRHGPTCYTTRPAAEISMTP